VKIGAGVGGGLAALVGPGGWDELHPASAQKGARRESRRRSEKRRNAPGMDGKSCGASRRGRVVSRTLLLGRGALSVER
jgi:hypothetical protein